MTPTRRAGISGWPIRRKLMALVALPLVVVLVAGSIFAISTARDYLNSRQTSQLAELAAAAVDVTGAVTSEFAVSTSVTQSREALPGTPLAEARQRTDNAVASMVRLIGKVRPGSEAPATRSAGDQAAQQVPDRIAGLRTQLKRPDVSQALLSGQYATILDLLSNYLTQISGDIGDAAANQEEINAALTQNAMLQVSVAAAQERSLYGQALKEGTLSIENNLVLQQLIAAQRQNLDAAALVSTTVERGPLDAIRAGDPQLEAYRNDAVDLLRADTADKQQGTAGDPNVYEQVSKRRLDQILALTGQVSGTLRDAAAQTERNNLLRAAAAAVITLLVFLLVGILVARLGRSIVVPLRLLRVGAGDAAHVNLPNAVAEIERNGPDAVVALPPVLPAGAAAGPETLDVARAVDNLGAEAVRLAASQVRLRRTLDDAFVSMSRRSQSMVEKQLAIIDELESTEEDPDQLRNLFRLDHLAARMRRYNDNLLVLAGSTMRNRTTAPVRVAELFRAATSEMEQYERVRLQPVGGAAVAGTVAGELIHLLAELLDNAAMYSPPSSSIVLSAAFTSDGGLHLEVVDSGVGIPADEIERLNARLARNETMDLQAASRIGLFVVARLARRGGFQVSLRQRPDANGTVAQVVVPPQVVIGAPGSTGEQPTVTSITAPQPTSAWAGPRTGPIPTIMPPSGVPAQPPAPDISRPTEAPAPIGWQAPAAPTGLTEPTVERTSNDPLPRRRRGASVPGPAGLGTPPADQRPASPEEGLFGPVDSEALRNGTAHAVDVFRDRQPAEPPADAPATFGLGGFDDPAGDPPTAAELGAASLSGLSGPTDLSGPADREPADQNGSAGGWRPAGTPTPGPADLPSGPTTGNGLPRRSGGTTRPAAGGWQGGDRTENLPKVVEPPADPFGTGLGGLGGGLGSGTGELKPANTSAPGGADRPAWEDDLLPTELAARAAAASSYNPANPDNPLIGNAPDGSMPDSTPIFDSISAWFSDEPAAEPAAAEPGVIDIRDGEPATVSRWDSLGDRQWLETSARASAGPEVGGRTSTGLPKRRPGANLLPSAAAAVAPPAPAPVRVGAGGGGSTGSGSGGSSGNGSGGNGAGGNGSGIDQPVASGRDAAAIRGRLGSYQRGLASARKNRPEPSDDEFGTFDPVGASLFSAPAKAEQKADGDTDRSAEQGGDS